MAVAAPAPFLPAAPPDLLQAALEIALTGFIIFRPLHDDADPAAITDLAYDYVNPTAQRMLGLPEHPAESFRTLYPSTMETGIFAFYCDTFRAGRPGRYDVNYQHDGLDNYFQLAAHRAGDLLVVSFTDTAEQSRTAVEEALRQSQAREQQARTEAEYQREELQRLFEQAPVALAVFQGPRYTVELANPEVLRLWGRTAAQALHTPLFELLPEITGQGFEELLDEVVTTGVPHVAHEMPSTIDRHGRRDTVYWNFVYQPLRGADGAVTGITVVATEVSEQVVARRQLQQLNQELEARVFARTQALRHAQADAVAAAQRLRRITDSLPSTSFTVDATGKVLYISPQWYAYTGIAPGADINEAWPGLIHPDDLPVITQEYGAALAEGRPWRYEFRLRGAAGQYRWFASQGVPEPLAEAEAAGRPRQWFSSNLDIDDLKQAQAAQQRQEQQLRQILRQSPAMIATLDGPDHRVSFTNPGYDALVGGRVQMGRPVAECLPEVVAQGFIDLLDGVYRTGEPFVGRETFIEFQPPGGVPVSYYLDFTYQALRDAHDGITGILAFVVDVTERVRARQGAEAAQAQLLATAEQAATQRETFYQVFEQTPALVQLLRAPGHRVEYVNPAYQQLFPGRPLVGLDLADALPELREQDFIALIDRVYRTGETYHGDDTPFTPTPAAGQPARPAYYNFTYQAYREHDQIAGISVFAYDVTGQVLACREREAQRRRLQDLFMQAPAAICILDGPDLVYELVNPGYQALFPGRVLHGRPLLHALPEIAGHAVYRTFRAVYETGVTHEEKGILVPLTQPDGTLEDRYFNYVQQARYDLQGRPDGVLVFAFEVTEQTRARQQAQALAGELIAANQQLTRTNVDLDTFIYTASHDLKAPITNIEGLLATLRDELPAAATGSEVPHILDLMQDSVERFTHTISHLTDVSRMQKEYDQPTHAVPLAAVIEGVRLDLAPLLRQTGGRLDVDVRAVPTVLFSEKNLRSVVFNLLSNAFKYRHPDRPPLVRVRARHEGTWAVLDVQDNGLGFDMGHETQLFAMFQRLHTHVEGSGVGLYMVKRLVENAGGRIAVESGIGTGTTFTVYLPQ